MSMKGLKGFILYRFYYEDKIVYLGRTKQKLQDRIRGHLFSKPMHRKININQVTKIEYAEFKTAADMNIYEIYLINVLKPPLNIDDKCQDDVTVNLPPVEWNVFTTHLWDKWKENLTGKDEIVMTRYRRYTKGISEDLTQISVDYHDGKITRDEWRLKRDELSQESKRLSKQLYG